MKIKCLYCDCYIETVGNSFCPMCGAPLSESVEAAEAEARREREEQAARAKAEAEAQRQENLNDSLTSLAVSAVGSLLGSGLGRSVARSVLRETVYTHYRPDTRIRLPRRGGLFKIGRKR